MKVKNQLTFLTLCFAISFINAENIDEVSKSTKQVILAIGGENSQGVNQFSIVERYDPLEPSNGWQTVSPMPTNRSSFGAAVLDNKVYVCGGTGEAPKNSCVTYDPTTDRWNNSGIASMNYEREGFTLTALGDYIYAVAGYPYSNTVERYDSEANVWERLNDFPMKIAYHSAVSLNGNLYVAGGITDTKKFGEVLTYFYRYNATIDSWQRLSDMPTPRFLASLVAVSTTQSADYLYMIGGENEKVLGSVERFNLEKNEWESENFPGSQLLSPRHSFGATLWGRSEIFIAGGMYMGPYDSMDKLSVVNNDDKNSRWEMIRDSKLKIWRYGLQLVSIEIPL